MGLLHKKLAYDLNGCFYHVQNKIGLGFDEETYHLGLEEYLTQRGISFKSKAIGYLRHRGVKVHKFIADFIIEDKIIVELKSSPLNFVPANFLQTISYLKNWNLNLGILVNFGQQSVVIERIPFSNKAQQFTEDYQEILPFLNQGSRDQLRLIRESILTIFEMHGLGYSANIYKSILQEEFSYRTISFTPKISIPVFFEEKIIRNFELKFPLVNNMVICGVYAIEEDLSTNIFKMRNYLRKTGYTIGLVIHFGKEKLEIIGVSP